MDDGFRVAVSGLGARIDLAFQLVAEGHQFIYPGDDAVLFVNGRERNWR